MKEVGHSISYGGEAIAFYLERSDRKTLSIAVHPLGEIVVRAPLQATLIKIQDKVQKRAFWITQQRKYFEQFLPRTPAKMYVGGESHYYLGRNYKLRIVEGGTQKVSLNSGRLVIQFKTDYQSNEIKRQLDAWYRKKAQHHFNDLMEKAWVLFDNKGLKKPKLSIRWMKTRWGSLSKKGRLSLNLELIKASKGAIEYVIIHELCHLVHPNHDKSFFALLGTVLPEWKSTKTKMERMLS